MRKAVLIAALMVVAAVAAMVGGSAASATETTSPRTVRVDDVLANRLEANPTGGVTAIVTTWNRDGLDAVEAAGVRGIRLKVMPMIITSALTKAQLSTLETMPEVRSVWGQREYKLFMEDSTWITKARYVWSTNTNAPDTHRGFNITGRGVELAIIDTGFDGKHEDGDNLIEYCNSMLSATGTRTEVVCTPWVATLNAAPAPGACGLLYPGPSNTGPGPTLAAPGCRNKAPETPQIPTSATGRTSAGRWSEPAMPAAARASTAPRPAWRRTPSSAPTRPAAPLS
jgi:subtilisin family serine protease